MRLAGADRCETARRVRYLVIMWLGETGAGGEGEIAKVRLMNACDANARAKNGTAMMAES